MEQLTVGTKVRTIKPLHDDDFSLESQKARRWGVEGEITAVRDSNGLYYDVWHGSSGGPYMPDEIEVLPPEFDCAKYIKCISIRVLSGMRIRDKALIDQFMPDAIREVGLEGHPRAEAAFHHAWMCSHAPEHLALSETDSQDAQALLGVLAMLRKVAVLMEGPV